MTETSLIVAATPICSLVIARVRCIVRPVQVPCFQSGCNDQPLEAKDDSEITVHKHDLAGHPVLVVCTNKE